MVVTTICLYVLEKPFFLTLGNISGANFLMLPTLKKINKKPGTSTRQTLIVMGTAL